MHVIFLFFVDETLPCAISIVCQVELDDSVNELKKLDELSKKAMSDAARLADELRQEQEHSMHIERLRKGLEQQLKVVPRNLS